VSSYIVKRTRHTLFSLMRHRCSIHQSWGSAIHGEQEGGRQGEGSEAVGLQAAHGKLQATSNPHTHTRTPGCSIPPHWLLQVGHAHPRAPTGLCSPAAAELLPPSLLPAAQQPYHLQEEGTGVSAQQRELCGAELSSSAACSHRATRTGWPRVSCSQMWCSKGLP
jgi:hypothetical protein